MKITLHKSTRWFSFMTLSLFGSLPTQAQIIDGIAIPSSGWDLLATQDTPTGFGNSSGTQASLGGSELNQLFGTVSGGILKLGITGNLEGNYNKMWIFFDGVSGGEGVLQNDNADGGFGEINNLAGLTFTGGFTADHGLRIEVGAGFYGIRSFDLIDNSAVDITTGGGPGDLPITSLGSNGILVGWDNSNSLGVDGASAANANTATTGWEFIIDLATVFGEVPASVGVAAFVSNGGGDFLSNQVLPGIGGGGNLGSPSGAFIGSVTVVPEPATSAFLLGLSVFGFLVIRRLRKD